MAPFFNVANRAAGCANQQGKIGDAGFVGRGGHCRDNDVGFGQLGVFVGIDCVNARLHLIIAVLEEGALFLSGMTRLCVLRYRNR
jgi:hypothetical protein